MSQQFFEEIKFCFHDKYLIKYRQESKNEECIVNRRIEIDDDDLTVTVIG